MLDLVFFDKKWENAPNPYLESKYKIAFSLLLITTLSRHFYQSLQIKCILGGILSLLIREIVFAKCEMHNNSTFLPMKI